MAEEKKEEKKKKYLDQFETDEELVKAYQERAAAYAELEKKLGVQGGELGETRKRAEALAAWAKDADPIVKFYLANQEELKKHFGEKRSAPTPAPDGKSPWSEIGVLTSDEVGKLATLILGAVQQQVLDPWQKQLTGNMEKYARDATGRLEGVLRSNSDVFWKTLEFLVGDEKKLNAARQWHTKALEMADPQKFDPMKASREWLDLQAENLRLTEAHDKTTKEYEDFKKSQSVSVGTGNLPSLLEVKRPETPMSKEERMKAAMEAVETEHGREALRDMFPSVR